MKRIHASLQRLSALVSEIPLPTIPSANRESRFKISQPTQTMVRVQIPTRIPTRNPVSEGRQITAPTSVPNASTLRNPIPEGRQITAPTSVPNASDIADITTSPTSTTSPTFQGLVLRRSARIAGRD